MFVSYSITKACPGSLSVGLHSARESFLHERWQRARYFKKITLIKVYEKKQWSDNFCNILKSLFAFGFYVWTWISQKILRFNKFASISILIFNLGTYEWT